MSASAKACVIGFLTGPVVIAFMGGWIWLAEKWGANISSNEMYLYAGLAAFIAVACICGGWVISHV